MQNSYRYLQTKTEQSIYPSLSGSLWAKAMPGAQHHLDWTAVKRKVILPATEALGAEIIYQMW